MAALEVYRTGLDKFPNDVSLLTGMSRIYEALGNITLSAKYYKMVLNVSKIRTISYFKSHFFLKCLSDFKKSINVDLRTSKAIETN
jgi:hypothetical protein